MECLSTLYQSVYAMSQTEQMEDLLEDWPESLDIFGSVWLEVLGGAETTEDWHVWLHLVELMCLDLLGQMDFLLDHRGVCFDLLGSMYADDPYLWTSLHS